MFLLTSSCQSLGSWQCAGPSPTSDAGTERHLWPSALSPNARQQGAEGAPLLSTSAMMGSIGQRLAPFALLRPLVISLLDYHAGRGDVQTCGAPASPCRSCDRCYRCDRSALRCITLRPLARRRSRKSSRPNASSPCAARSAAVVSQVLHPVAPDLIPQDRRQRWLLGYIELLQRLQLFELANHIIKNSDLERISAMNNLSTSINQQKPPGAGCGVCQLPVRGLYAWCQGCGHGGHAAHMRQWFEKNVECPTGCGHRCQIRLVAPYCPRVVPQLPPVASEQRASTDMRLCEVASQS